MSLSYYFTFTAPAIATADELTAFLKGVEKEAQRMGFRPTVVLNVPFDTAERRQFARRLTTGFRIEDERLKGVALPGAAAVWEHNPRDGSCHLLPTRGVVLVVTDEHGCETDRRNTRCPTRNARLPWCACSRRGEAGRRSRW